MTIILELVEASQEDELWNLLLFCYYSDSKFYYSDLIVFESRTLHFIEMLMHWSSCFYLV